MSEGEKPMKGATILVVEDEGIIAMHLQRLLTGFGFCVPHTAETGEEALRLVEMLKPDLVLMDIQLQGDLDGIETARRMHHQSNTPVVYLTAYGEDARLEQARHTSPYGYLIKPVQGSELRATIEMALYKHKLDMRLRESEAAYRQLYHNTPAMLQSTDLDGNITQVSDYWLGVLGYTRDEVIGQSLINFLPPGSLSYFIETLVPLLVHNGAVHDAECQLLHKDGHAIDVLFSTIALYDLAGQMTQALTVLVDITARKRVETAERDQRALAEALRDTAAALSSTLSLDEVLERVLTNVGKVVPYDAVSIMLVEDGIVHVARSHGFQQWGLEDGLMAMRWKLEEHPILHRLARDQETVMLVDTLGHPGWRMEWIRSYIGAPLVVKGRAVGFINLVAQRPGFFTAEHARRLRAFADQVAIAIENAHLYAEVERLATLDEVTGISNRRRLFEMGQREFDRTRRYHEPLSAILLDLDHFKKINDTFGHNAGDRVLAGIAALIKNSVRDVDLFGRYGGEEFVLLLPNQSEQQALEVAERLRALVENLHFQTERGELHVTISLGIALLTADIPSLATLIDRADQAMYAAKQAGRNRVQLFDGEA